MGAFIFGRQLVAHCDVMAVATVTGSRDFSILWLEPGGQPKVARRANAASVAPLAKASAAAVQAARAGAHSGVVPTQNPKLFDITHCAQCRALQSASRAAAQHAGAAGLR